MNRARRRFLETFAALPLLTACATRATTRELRLAAATQPLVGGAHPQTQVWAYNGSVPGPELRFRQGDRLRVGVVNDLDVETTVHWHGVRVPNAMDGVPNVTQKPIAARGGRFLYEFDLPDAGTYWYHPHLGSPEQVARGLSGPLIVEEREPPPVDRDLVWVLSDWRLDREARIAPDFMAAMDASHAGRIGNTVTVNGLVRETFAVRPGERIRLRLVNASNARIYGLSFEGHRPWLIALDGHPVQPREAPRVVLGPAQRADLILDCAGAPGTRHHVIDDFYARRAYRLLDLVYSDQAPLRKEFAPVVALPANPVRRPDVDAAQRQRIVFGGGAMGAVPNQREHRGLYWTVNGAPAKDDHRHAPLATLRLGASYRLELVNETAWHHPIHLHGHVFQVLSGNQKDTWADTVLVDPRSRAEIAFVADNPGDWMLHCHVLEHQASGMMAALRVT